MLDAKAPVQNCLPAAPQNRVKQEATNHRSKRREQRKKENRPRMLEAARDHQIVVHFRQRQQRRVERANQNHCRPRHIKRRVNDEIAQPASDYV